MRAGLRFFVVAGAILIVAGVAQVFARPRRTDETPFQRLVNPATIQAVVFVAVGVLGILVGLGALPVPRLGR